MRSELSRIFSTGREGKLVAIFLDIWRLLHEKLFDNKSFIKVLVENYNGAQSALVIIFWIINIS